MDERITGNDSDVALGATLRHANVVLADRVVEADVALASGLIVEQARSGAPEIDLGGDYLIAGLIDLHTDNIEHHFHPRPGVRWPSGMAAAMAHDWQMLGSGITTVLDSLSIGDYDSGGNL